MKIEYMGDPPYHGFSIDGAKITINGETYDLDALRKDSEVDINIYDDSKNFVANIVIPPNEYTYKDTGKKDESGNAVYEKILNPLNLDKVKLIVWHKIEKSDKNMTEEV